MNLLFTITAYPPAIGGAQLHMHQLACQLKRRHTVQVVTHWDMERTDWLLGTTLNAPREPKKYQIDGVNVQRIALSEAIRWRLAPWVLFYYAVHGPALAHISQALSHVVAPWAT